MSGGIPSNQDRALGPHELQMWILTIIGVVLVLVTLYDLIQHKHAILRNYPIIGHFRYFFEAVGPELRQYIVTSNNEERPFSRDQRSWIYASSKNQNNYRGFGTDEELELSPNYMIIKHSAFPLATPGPGSDGYDPDYPVACAKVLGAARDRKKAFRPASIVNVSGMSFGSLSGRAVEALNLGSRDAGCFQNTGEGGVAPYHMKGGDLVWQIGTGYFGCRDERGRFSMEKFVETVNSASDPGDRDKAEPGREAGDRRLIARSQSLSRDRGDTRHTRWTDMRESSESCRIRRRRQHARLCRASGRQIGLASWHQVGRWRYRFLYRVDPPDDDDRQGSRLCHDRRWRRWNRCRTSGVYRSRRPAFQAGF